MDRRDYISDSEWKHFMSFSENLETPCVVINLKTIKKNYQKLRENFPYADIFYAIKANPHEEIITMLNEMGSCFDIASRYELDKVLKLGVSPERLSYGNTIKKAKDIAYFYEKGVRMFATDSKDDLNLLPVQEFM